MSLDRPLRLLTCLATAIAVPLTIAATVLSLEHQKQRWARRHATAFPFAFIPLALTVASASITLQYIRKHDKSPSAWAFKALDLASALGYLGVLVPCWTVEIREFNAPGFGLLIGYTSAPMILNLFIHIYFMLSNVPFKKLMPALRKRSSSCKQCPHCQAKVSTETTTKKGYSLLRGEDYLDIEADPIQYRDSDDFLGADIESADKAKQSADGVKNKDMKEV